MEFFEIILSGIFGWDITYDNIVAQTREAGGKRLKIKIASDGGSVSESVAIYNHLKDYQAQNGQISIEMTGWVQSAAGYVTTLPGAHVTAHQNSAMMIHNPWNIALGDYRVMNKSGKVLEATAINLAANYAAKSGQSLEDVRAELDEETYLFGKEILDTGYADEYSGETVEIETKDDDDNVVLLGAAASGNRDAMIKIAKERAQAAMWQVSGASMNGHKMNKPAGPKPVENKKTNGQNPTGDNEMSEKNGTPEAKPEITPAPVAEPKNDAPRMSACIGAIKAFPKDADMLQKAFDDGRGEDFFAGFMARADKEKAAKGIEAAVKESASPVNEKESPKMSGDEPKKKTPGLTGGVSSL